MDKCPIFSPPSIYILYYVSPVNNSHLSHFILHIILRSALGLLLRRCCCNLALYSFSAFLASSKATTLATYIFGVTWQDEQRRIGCWKCFNVRGRGYRVTEENCIRRSFMICTLYQILFGWFKKEKRDRWVMWYEWGIEEVHTGLLYGNLRKTDGL